MSQKSHYPPGWPRPKIVVIDDDSGIREALMLAFEDAYEVCSYASGPEGVAAMSPEVHVVILDIKMKDRDGFWTFKAIRRHYSATPIIFFSAFQNLKNPYEVMNEFRPFGYVCKDQNLKDLKVLVRQAVAEYTLHLRRDAQLRVADRLAALGTLAAGAAHEINNPLAFIVGNLEVVSDKLDENPMVQDYCVQSGVDTALAEAIEGAARIRRIVEDLRSFGRTSDPEGADDRCNVHESLELSLRMAANEIKHKATVVKDYGEIPAARIERNRMCQVFLNLLVNAAHALTVGEAYKNEIRIRTFTDATGHVVIEIQDTGPGIPAAVAERVFDPFFTTKPVNQGTGLGLFVTHNLVVSAGGSIELVESSSERGTLFRLRVPASSALPEPASVAAPAPISRSLEGESACRRVLVVDDEPMIGSLIQRVLPDHDVTYVDSGRAAIELCGREDFDVILCDVMMPEYSGIDVYKRLESALPAMERRIIFMTAGLYDPDATRFLEALQNPCLTKPILRNTLLQCIESWAAQNPPH